MDEQCISLFVVEDHPIMQQALRVLIAAQPGLEICGEAASAEEALDRLPAEADLVLVDVSLPGMNGLELVRQVGARWPDLPCLVLSGHAADRYAEPARQAGAIGYLMKGNATALLAALEVARSTNAGGDPPLSFLSTP